MSDMAADTRDVPCLTPRCLYVGQPRKSEQAVTRSATSVAEVGRNVSFLLT